MSWSTREIAGIAGTTVNAIRHYHQVGLLDEPERRYNGYKQYGVRELVSLLRILRMVHLGVPLAQIAELGDDERATRETLRKLDENLASRIESLQQARDDISAILRDDAPADAPAGFVSVASRLSESDTSLLHIAGRLYDEAAMADLRRMVERDVDTEAAAEIDALPADADEVTRERLASRLAPTIAQNLLEHPWLLDPAEHLTKGAALTQATLLEALSELYNPAQLDVLVRAGHLAQKQLQEYGLTA